MVARQYDDAGRLEHQQRDAAQASTRFVYDGRGFLRQALGVVPDGSGGSVFCDGFESGDTAAWGETPTVPGTCFATVETSAVYSSDGVLHSATDGGTTHHIVYFGGRPIAQYEPTTSNTLHLTPDHLGTPILATDTAGAVAWSGGIEPFGADASGASAAGVFLRFPGQWVARAWEDSSRGVLANNVHRWYETSAALYSRPDPLGVFGSATAELSYSQQNPLVFADPYGLETCFIFSLTRVGDIGDRPAVVVDHVGLYIDGAASSGACEQVPETLYDPNGGYRASELGSSRLVQLYDTPQFQGDTPITLQGYYDYQCRNNSPGSMLEVVCFRTTCEEETEIVGNALAVGGGSVLSCSRDVSSAVAGVGPFSSIEPGIFRPAVLRRKLGFLFLEYQRPARYNRQGCGS